MNNNSPSKHKDFAIPNHTQKQAEQTSDNLFADKLAVDQRIEETNENQRLFQKIFCQNCNWNEECNTDHDGTLSEGAECEAGSAGYRMAKKWFESELTREQGDAKQILQNLSNAIDAALNYGRRRK